MAMTRGEISRRWRERNREHVLAYGREYSNAIRHQPWRRFQVARGTARRRGWAWELTLPEYCALTEEPCHYCGGPLPEKGGGLDRADNAEGYTLKNALPCCFLCNRTKGDGLTYAEMKLIMRLRQEVWEAAA